MDIKGYRLFPSLMRVKPIEWQRVFEHPGNETAPSKGRSHYRRRQHQGDGYLHIPVLYMKEVVRLSRRSGLLFTALYLKQCASS